MNTPFHLAILLTLAAPALAQAPQPASAARSEPVEYNVESSGCRIHLRLPAARADDREPPLLTLQEYCDDKANTETESHLLRAVFQQAFNDGALNRNQPVIWMERMSSMPFECELLRHAAASEDWPKLLKRLGGKPKLFKEGLPKRLQAEIGGFIHRGGLLRNLEEIFANHGYRLRQLAIGGFWLHSLEQLTPAQRACAGSHPVASVLPTAETLMVFEAAPIVQEKK